MHSRIFYLVPKGEEEKIENIDKDNSEYIYEQMNGFSDYVYLNNEYLSSDFEWLVGSSYKSFIKVNKEKPFTITIELEPLEQYFRDKIQSIKDLAENLTVKSFSYYLGNFDLWDLQEAIEAKDGFYIFDGETTETIDSWLRTVYSKMLRENKSSLEYTLLQSYDYHF